MIFYQNISNEHNEGAILLTQSLRISLVMVSIVQLSQTFFYKLWPWKWADFHQSIHLSKPPDTRSPFPTSISSIFTADQQTSISSECLMRFCFQAFRESKRYRSSCHWLLLQICPPTGPSTVFFLFNP